MSQTRFAVLGCGLGVSLAVLAVSARDGRAAEPTDGKAPVAETPVGPEAASLKKLSMAELMKINVLSSASFFEVETEKNLGFSQTFSAAEIADSPIRTIGDLIDMKCPSFALGGSPREGLQIGGRGITSENTWRTVYLIDGQNVNHRVHFGMLEAISTPVLGDIKSVEVITGPGAIVHGSGAFDGVINITPRNGTDDKGLNSTVEYGTEEELKKLEAGYGLAYGPGRDVYIDAAYFTAPGFQADDKWGYGHPNLVQTARAFSFPNDNYRLATYWNHDDLKTHVIFGLTDQGMNSFEEQGYMQSQYLLYQTKYRCELNAANSLEFILASELFDEYQLHSANMLGYFAAGKVGGDELGGEATLIYRTEIIPKNRIAFGGMVEPRDMHSQEQFFRSNDLAGPGNDASGEYVSTALFAEDIISPTEKLTAHIGLRYDKRFQGTYQSLNTPGGVTPAPFTPTDFDHLSPRVGLVYELGKNDTVKLSYQQAFRFPEVAMYGWHSAFDTILASGGYAALPKIKPETLDSIELNYIKKFPDQHLTANLNLFHNMYDNRLTWITFKPGDGYLQPAGYTYVVGQAGWAGSYVNIRGKEYQDGGELVLAYAPTDDLSVNAGYEYVHINNRDVIRYPNHQLKLNLKASFLKKRLVCDLYYLANPGGIDNPDSIQNPIYNRSRQVINLAVSYKLTENLKLKVAVENLLADDVPPPTFFMDRPESGHIGSDARRIYLSMIARF